MKNDEIVLKALSDNGCHPDVNELVKSAFIQDSKMGIATLYRKLKKLTQMGKIKKIEGLEQSAHFDHNTHEHYHFICSKCGKIYDVDKEMAKEFKSEILKKYGHDALSMEITFKGICKNCKK